MESHFNKNHLESLIRSGPALDCSGKSARDLPERFLSVAVREAFDRELAYPASLVHGLRPYFNEQNLQVFKHRKRVLYLSAVRPKPVSSSNEFADGPATLLTVIGESPRISKRDLAVKILGATDPESPESPETAARKTQLAADLHYLVHTGHVIEFADGKLDLPLSPAAQAATESAAPEDEGPEEDLDTTAVAKASKPASAESTHSLHKTAESAETFSEPENTQPESAIPSPASEPIAEPIEINESVQNSDHEELENSEETSDEPQGSSESVKETEPSEPGSAPAN